MVTPQISPAFFSLSRWRKRSGARVGLSPAKASFSTAPGILALLLAVAGCKLIDQRTFNPNAGKPPAPPVVVGPSAPPLLTIRVDDPTLSYEPILRQQVAAALARKPDVVFDVVTVVPATGTPAAQTAAATGVIADARQVARAINNEGVDDPRIHLAARSEPGLAAREIRVFVH